MESETNSLCGSVSLWFMKIGGLGEASRFHHRDTEYTKKFVLDCAATPAAFEVFEVGREFWAEVLIERTGTEFHETSRWPGELG